MVLASPSRRRRRLPLTPLIDVIFLLLLFFMLSSTFLRFQSVEVTARKATQGGSASTGATALLTVRSGTVSLNGKSLTVEGLNEALSTLSERGTARLVLTADTSATTQDLVDVLEVVERGSLPLALVGRAAGQRR